MLHNINICEGGRGVERERDRDRDTERERQTDRDRERQTERETETERRKQSIIKWYTLNINSTYVAFSKV